MKPFPQTENWGTELAPAPESSMSAQRTTFPRNSAHLSGSSRRGFTLLELMVVVLIITIVSSIAIPGVVQRMKTNRTREAAEDLAMVFRQARIRAMGRNSAVLVRYNDAAGTVELREAIQGATASGGVAVAGCERRPESNCRVPANRWNNGNARSQSIEITNYEASGDFTLDGPGTDIDICFAPSGRSYIRNTAASTTPFAAWTTPVRFDIDRNDGVGIRRSVLLTPSGTARVVAAP